MRRIRITDRPYDVPTIEVGEGIGSFFKKHWGKMAAAAAVTAAAVGARHAYKQQVKKNPNFSLVSAAKSYLPFQNKTTEPKTLAADATAERVERADNTNARASVRVTEPSTTKPSKFVTAVSNTGKFVNGALNTTTRGLQTGLLLADIQGTMQQNEAQAAALQAQGARQEQAERQKSYPRINRDVVELLRKKVSIASGGMSVTALDQAMEILKELEHNPSGKLTKQQLQEMADKLDTEMDKIIKRARPTDISEQ